MGSGSFSMEVGQLYLEPQNCDNAGPDSFLVPHFELLVIQRLTRFEGLLYKIKYLGGRVAPLTI